MKPGNRLFLQSNGANSYGTFVSVDERVRI